MHPSAFTFNEFENKRLKKLLDYVVENIPTQFDDSFPCVYIVEGPVSSKEGAYFEPSSNTVRLNPEILEKYSDSVLKGIIAHELAHAFHQHGTEENCSIVQGMKNEEEADATAIEWGFKHEVNAMRQRLGYPTPF